MFPIQSKTRKTELFWKQQGRGMNACGYESIIVTEKIEYSFRLINKFFGHVINTRGNNRWLQVNQNGKSELDGIDSSVHKRGKWGAQ